MATEGGKIKVKRRTAPSKPYERNLTLFGKLRKSVKELLIPSWLSRPEQGSESLGTGDACLAAQSSVPAGECNSGVVSGAQLHNKAGDGHAGLVQQPSTSSGEQTRLPAALHDVRGQGEGSIPTPGEKSVYDHRAGRVANVSSITDRRVKPATNKRNTSSTPRFGDEFDEPASSRVHHVASHGSESYLDTQNQSRDVGRAHPIMTSTRVLNQSMDVSNPAAKRQRLWSPDSERQGKYFSSPVKEKPAFNSVLLGSVSDSSMLGDSLHTSVFYPGKTRFGGASAERRTSLNTSLPYQSSLPLRKQVRPHSVRNNIQATTSATAQRILETLDRMSTPLGDAKKIPVSDSPNDSVLSFTPSSYRRTSFQMGRPATRPLQLPSRAPPTSQHQVLAQAVIAQNRHTSGIVDKRHNSSVIEDHNDDDRSMSIHVSQEARTLLSRVQPPASSETGGILGHQSDVSGKMKAKRFTQHISNVGVDSDVMEVPNLRTEFTLPICNMGPISLQPMKSLTVAASSAPPADDTVPMKFIFSAPIDEKRQACSQMSSGVSDKNFKFTSPIKTSQTKTSAAGAEGESKSCQEPAVGASSGMPMWTSSSFTASVPAWGSTAPKPKMASPDIGGTSSSFKSYNKWGGFEKPDDSSAASDTPVGFSLAPAATLKTGSVMDILGGKSSIPVSTPATMMSNAAKEPGTEDLMAKFKKAAGSWECDACMLVNKPEANKCVCCDTTKPGAKPAACGSGTTTASSSSSTVPGTSPSPESSATSIRPSGSSSSMLSNKEVALPGTKPGTGVSPENSLSALFKKPAGSWECDTCLVQNTATAVRCLACDSSKPGLQAAGIVCKPSASTTSSAITVSPAGGFTFNVSTTTTTTSGSSGFKFGNTSTAALTSSSSTPTATGFVFGQVTSANKNSDSSTGSTSSTLLTGGFKFGATGPGSGGGGQTFAGGSSSFLAGKTSILTEPKAAAHTEVAAGHLPTNGVPLTADSKSNISTNATAFQPAGNPNGALQFGTALTTKDSNIKLSQQVSFNFTPVSSASSPALVAPLSQQQTEKPVSAVSGPASNLFQFGASSVPAASSSGLGMGNSLADARPVLNGGFGSGFGAPTGKDNSGAASLDSSKSLASFTFGTNQPPPTFASFGQVSAATVGSSQVSQSGKRTVDFGEADHSSAKKSFNFGTSSSDAPSNGLFTFGGSSESKTSAFAVSSTASSSTGGCVLLSSNQTGGPAPGGGFQFSNSSNQTGGPAPGGGFQFSHGSSAAPAFQGFNFSLKAPNETPKLASFEAPVLQGATSFNATPSFNFSSTSQPNSVFQFGAKP
ncbi:unnamed protein product, partial [Candidula unifasciata]